MKGMEMLKDRQQSIRPILVWSQYTEDWYSLLVTNIHNVYYLKDVFMDYLMI